MRDSYQLTTGLCGLKSASSGEPRSAPKFLGGCAHSRAAPQISGDHLLTAKQEELEACRLMWDAGHMLDLVPKGRSGHVGSKTMRLMVIFSDSESKSAPHTAQLVLLYYRCLKFLLFLTQPPSALEMDVIAQSSELLTEVHCISLMRSFLLGHFLYSTSIIDSQGIILRL